jgi:exodeoxyribonuclease VII small subunit
MAGKKGELKFEDAVKRLEEIAESMENNELSLEDSIKLFQEGVELAAICNKKLDEAERKIKVLVKGTDNNMIEQEFVPEEE